MGMTIEQLKDALAKVKQERERAFAVFHQMLGAERQLELVIDQWEKNDSPEKEQTPAQ